MTSPPNFRAHRPLAGLAADLASAAQHVTVGGRYAHYKQPDRPYCVTGLVILEEDEAVAVAYNVESESKVTFIRPLSDWLETVEWNNQRVPRFSPIA
jgi:hypothetical protein